MTTILATSLKTKLFFYHLNCYMFHVDQTFSIAMFIHVESKILTI